MNRKLTDTSIYISHAGRAERYWDGKSVKSKYSAQEDSRADIDLHKLLQKYSIKGFEFGNWVNNNDRYDRALACQKALYHLAWIMKTQNLGMNGQLGIAFGARGMGGGAVAHFEPKQNMINLTKMNGHLSLAHEYGHALDWNFGRFIDQNKNYNYLTGGRSTAQTLPDNTGGQFRHYANAIVDTIKQTESYARTGTSDYLSSCVEIFARAFEQYVCWCIKSASRVGANTNYLCKSWSHYTSDRAYLTEKDFKLVLPLFTKLVGEFGKYCNGRGKVTAMPYPVVKSAAKKSKPIKIATPKRTTKKAAAKKSVAKRKR